VALQLGLCEYLDLKSLYLLTFLVMGAVLANSHEDAGEIVNVLDHFTGLLCVVFFVIHGAELDLGKLMEAGAIGAVYIVLRTVGKYFGVYLTAGSEFRGTPVQRWLGASLLSQAGAAIALCAVAKEVNPALGVKLETIILGTVAFFEIVGPVLVRHAVLRGGEVPLSHAIDHTSSTPLSALAGIVNRGLESLGFDPWHKKDAGNITIEQLMFRNVKPVPASASFREVVRSIEHSHDNTFPVTGSQEELIGVIHYVDLRNEVFDAEISTLVCAEDLARPVHQSLHADQPLASAWEIFRHSADDIIVVVTRETPARLVGVVRRRDVLKFLHTTNQVSSQDTSVEGS
jgi:predicted transcriptional regulator